MNSSPMFAWNIKLFLIIGQIFRLQQLDNNHLPLRKWWSLGLYWKCYTTRNLKPFTKIPWSRYVIHHGWHRGWRLPNGK
ncbi:MAG: hypothetical protein CM1200mP27_12530 [Chloroflexota bacterium]|nr:MAG: hypothetical protein CM1200mP27_12530 [Chloroflexota bacterium]